MSSHKNQGEINYRKTSNKTKFEIKVQIKNFNSVSQIKEDIFLFNTLAAKSLARW